MEYSFNCYGILLQGLDHFKQQPVQETHVWFSTSVVPIVLNGDPLILPIVVNFHSQGFRRGVPTVVRPPIYVSKLWRSLVVSPVTSSAAITKQERNAVLIMGIH